MVVFMRAYNKLCERGEVDALIRRFHLNYRPLIETIEEQDALGIDQNPHDLLEDNSDILGNILYRRQVKIGATKNKYSGSIGNYTVNEPVGFFPILMRLIWSQISSDIFNDPNAITVKYEMYTDVFNALSAGAVDMTENYFIVIDDNNGKNQTRNDTAHILRGSGMLEIENKIVVLSETGVTDMFSFEQFVARKPNFKLGCVSRVGCLVFSNAVYGSIEYVFSEFQSHSNLINALRNYRIDAFIVPGIDRTLLQPGRFTVINTGLFTKVSSYFKSNSSYFTIHPLIMLTLLSIFISMII